MQQQPHRVASIVVPSRTAFQRASNVRLDWAGPGQT